MRKYATFPSIWHGSEITQALAEHEGLVHWVVRRQWLGVPPTPRPCTWAASPCGGLFSATTPHGSVRLAREVPYASKAWKKRYGRRSFSESRNGSQEGMGLKRLPNFGLNRNR